MKVFEFLTSSDFISFVLIIAGSIILFNSPEIETITSPENLVNFLYKISPEIIGIGLGVLLIGKANTRRAKKIELEQLISQMCSPFNDIACDAVRLLNLKKYLAKDYLKNRDLFDANLKGADLYNAQLQGVRFNNANLIKANLNGANLENAKLYDTKLEYAMFHCTNLKSAEIFSLEDNYIPIKNAEMMYTNLQGAKFKVVIYGNEIQDPLIILSHVERLTGSILPDGSRYDGRLRIKPELSYAKYLGYDLNDNEAMAEYYDVTLEEYLNGQKWADNYFGTPD